MSTKAAAKRREEVLKEWCEAATTKAREASGRSDLDWKKGGESIYNYHCPLPGHAWKGDDQSAWVTVDKDGRIKAGCRKCSPKGSEQEAAYTETMKDVLGWEDEDGLALRPGKEYRLIREHFWRTWDDAYEVKTMKVRQKGDRTDKWWWRFREVDPARQGYLTPAWKSFPGGKPNEWAAERYPVLKTINNSLKLYRDEAFEGRDIYSVVVCEGAKDADTVRDLLSTVPNCSLITTATQSPKLTALAPHHEARLRGHRVTVLGDNDQGGEDFRKCWAGLLWPVAKSVKLFPSDQLFGEGQDVTDWVEERKAKGATFQELGKELMDAIVRTSDLAEPPEEVKTWFGKLKRGERGISKTSVANGRIVWTEHPDLAGRVSTNSRSGEVEVVHPPWGGEKCVGMRRAARSCAAWLEEHHEVALSISVLEDALVIDGVAPMQNPLAGLLIADDWDGVPRLDGLFTHYLPLKVDHGPAVRLARIFMGDLVAKLSGKLVPQRLLVAIHTDEPLDVAGALLGRHGVRHRGRVEMRQVVQFAQQEAGIVQISTEPVVDKNMARGSVAHLFASHLAQPHGWISSPMFVAVGSAGPSIDSAATSHVDERCLVLEPSGPMRLDALRADADQLLAEATARRDELIETQVVRRSEVRTVDDAEVDESLVFMVKLIYEASIYQFDHTDQALMRLTKPPLRATPKEFIDRSWFLDLFMPALANQWRDRGTQAKMFNRACRRMGFVHHNGRVLIQPTRFQAERNGIFWPEDKAEKPQIIIPGVRLTEERREKISAFLYDAIINPEKDPQKDLPNLLQEGDKFRKSHGPITREEKSYLELETQFPACARTYTESNKEGVEEEAEKIISLDRLDGAHVEAIQEGDGWLILVDGIEVDQAVLIAALREWPPWEDQPQLVTTDGAGLRAWLAEVGVEAGVEEVA